LDSLHIRSSNLCDISYSLSWNYVKREPKKHNKRNEPNAPSNLTPKTQIGQKKTPLCNRAGFATESLAILLVASLGSFKRIDFLLGTRFFEGNMGCQITIPIFPFQ
jgi:hypothetical protein